MPTEAVLDDYCGDESNQFSFYRIPRQLIAGDRFKRLSADSKLLYGLLLDRMGLSATHLLYDRVRGGLCALGGLFPKEEDYARFSNGCGLAFPRFPAAKKAWAMERAVRRKERSGKARRHFEKFKGERGPAVYWPPWFPATG